MSYVKVEDGQITKYPFSIGDLRRENPNTSFPRRIPDETLASYGVYPVSFASAPKIDKRAQEVHQNSFPSFIDGGWIVEWSVTDKSESQVQSFDDEKRAVVRLERDDMLAETDWVVVFHTEKGTSIPTEWAAYRQALRDVTTQEGFPWEVEWPLMPSA